MENCEEPFVIFVIFVGAYIPHRLLCVSETGVIIVFPKRGSLLCFRNGVIIVFLKWDRYRVLEMGVISVGKWGLFS